MLLDDSVRAHDRALQAGTDARIDVWPALPHVFPLFEMLPESRRALAEIVAFIHRHVRRSPP
jgi:acetyl esterase/lipase